MLRQTLFELVLVAAASGCSGGHQAPDAFVPGDPCGFTQMLTDVIPEPPPADLLDIVRKCEGDPTQCTPLCQRVLDTQAFPGSTLLRSCEVTHTAADHTVKVGYCMIGAEGRRPHGLAAARRRCCDEVGARFARAAFYEAASVHAFVHLARELRRHRAPRALIAAARHAAVDEIRHARTMAALANARGATPPPVVVATPRRRSIESLAIENAREGMVGETWSAMTAVHQAHHAAPALRETYARIAADELRHAELSFALDTWAQSRLPRAARARVAAERARAVAQLARQVRRAPARTLAELGLPDTVTATRLFAAARDRIWS